MTQKDVRCYPCRPTESAIKLAERFIAGVIKPRPAPQPEATLSSLPRKREARLAPGAEFLLEMGRFASRTPKSATHLVKVPFLRKML